MRGAVVREIGAREFCASAIEAAGLVNLVVLASIGGDEEEWVRRLSELDHCAVIARTGDACVVADCGEIAGRTAPAFSADGNGILRCQNLSCGRVGILTGDDVYYPEAARALAADGAELLVVVRAETDLRAVVMARSHAVANGVRTLYCADETGFAADFTGRVSTFDGRIVSVECELLTESGFLDTLRHKGILSAKN